MSNDFKNLVRFNDKVFWIDLTDWENDDGVPVIDVINPDGSRREGTFEDGNLFELLRDGKIIGDSPEYPKNLADH